LVFIHGVATRAGVDYTAGVRTRDALFRGFLLASHRRRDGGPIEIESPYWGDHGAQLRWGGASVPTTEVEALGSADAALADLHASALLDGEVESGHRVVLPVARRCLPNAVDLIWGASALVESGSDMEAVELGRLAALVIAYANADPRPAWMAEVDNDQDLITRLQHEVDGYWAGAAGQQRPRPEWETLGIDEAWNAVRRGVTRLGTAVAGTIGRAASERIRPAVVPGVANFIGDVLVYFHHQHDTAAPIRETVAAAIRDAHRRTEQADPLVVVAHSMGGSIAYDLLTSELGDLHVTLLVTAGTQVGFFAELGLFRGCEPTAPQPGERPKIPKPANVDRWINVFDHNDLLGFLVGPVIEGVDDFTYRTGSLFRAHSHYFFQPSFHHRVAVRARSSG